MGELVEEVAVVEDDALPPPLVHVLEIDGRDGEDGSHLPVGEIDGVVLDFADSYELLHPRIKRPALSDARVVRPAVEQRLLPSQLDEAETADDEAGRQDELSGAREGQAVGKERQKGEHNGIEQLPQGEVEDYFLLVLDFVGDIISHSYQPLEQHKPADSGEMDSLAGDAQDGQQDEGEIDQPERHQGEHQAHRAHEGIGQVGVVGAKEGREAQQNERVGGGHEDKDQHQLEEDAAPFLGGRDEVEEYGNWEKHHHDRDEQVAQKEGEVGQETQCYSAQKHDKCQDGSIARGLELEDGGHGLAGDGRREVGVEIEHHGEDLEGEGEHQNHDEHVFHPLAGFKPAFHVAGAQDGEESQRHENEDEKALQYAHHRPVGNTEPVGVGV